MDTNLGEVVLVQDIYPGVTEYSVSTDPTPLDSDLPTDSPPPVQVPNNSIPNGLVEFNDKLYFKANDGVNGDELFVSDGTAEGTELVKDISPGEDNYGNINGSYPLNFVEFNDKLYFTASDEETGRELYVTDGTAGGTELLKDIYPGENGYFPNSSYPENFAEFNDKLYFSASNGENGIEVYVSDGTSEGTKLLVDLNPGEIGDGAKSSYPDNFIAFNDKLYFTANSAESDNGLYVSDGTAEGTELLVDLGAEGTSQADNFVEFNGKLYFSANNGENGNVLYVSDGTAEGTQLLVDINPGEDNYGIGNGLYGREFVEFNDKLYFKASNGESGSELYVSDGTAEGTQLLVDLYPGKASDGYDGYGSFPSDLVVFNDKLYFTADDGENGYELYVSDGTAEGTQLVSDIYPGEDSDYGFPNSSFPSDLTVVGDELFFAADNGETGTELFKLTLGSEGEDLLYEVTGDDLAAL
jgi:ELWxxDGT repeat protein